MSAPDVFIGGGVFLLFVLAIFLGVRMGDKKRKPGSSETKEPPKTPEKKTSDKPQWGYGNYSCGACGTRFPEPLSRCPHPGCGRYFSGTKTVHSQSGCAIPFALLIGNLFFAIVWIFL